MERARFEALVCCSRWVRRLAGNSSRSRMDADSGRWVQRARVCAKVRVLKIARCSRLMQIVCVCGCLTRREPGVEWSGVSLGESEVDCIGVGHGSCSVMHALVGQDLCLCLRLCPSVWRCDKPWKGEIWGKAAMGLPWCQGKSKGQAQGQGTAGKSRRARGKGRCRGVEGAHVLYEVTCHVEVSQQQHARPPRGRTTQTRLCTYYVAAPREAVVRPTARDWNGTCQTLPAIYSGTLVPG